MPDLPRIHELTNGRHHVKITTAGGGQSLLEWIALNRWAGDAVEDSQGFFIYLQDVEDGTLWSAGLQPTVTKPDGYSLDATSDEVTIVRRDHGIASKMSVTVDKTDDVEIRRLELTNESDRKRCIQITSCIEVALAHPMGDLGHPAFSKLFVQTEWLHECSTLVAKRRPRAHGEKWPAMFHAMTGAAPTAWETDRLRFIGRGRSLARPAFVVEGTVGNVLDPVFCLRTSIQLDPGESREIRFLLGAVWDHQCSEQIVRRLQKVAAAQNQNPPHPNPLPQGEGDCGAAAPIQSCSFSESSGSSACSLSQGERVGVRGNDVGSTLRRPSSITPTSGPATLQHFNGYGGFNEDGSEYVIRMPWRDDGLLLPPMPWCNVVANERFGFITSETGAGCTWSRNSQANRLTPWSNDPVSDPHGEALYVRDEATGEFWSPLPGPCSARSEYEMAHGFGYSRCRVSTNDIEHETTMFVPRNDSVKFVRLRLKNTGSEARRLSLFSFHRPVLGTLPPEPGTILVRREGDVLLATNPKNADFSDGTAFSFGFIDGVPDVEHEMSTDRAAFIGMNGSLRAPRALLDGRFDDKGEQAAEPCFAHRWSFELPASGEVECCVMLGETTDESQRTELLRRYSSAAAVEAALSEVAEFWRELLGRVKVRTPSPEIDRMVNGWLPYQAIVCRMWGRTAFYQSSGAFGFRDQLQDAGNLMLLWPELTRNQIRLNARHQFVEGDVLHWWHEEPVGRGVRTRFSDDLLWLPFVTSEYVRATGDTALLDEREPFVEAPLLKPGEDENYLKPTRSESAATIYEHCCLAIERSLTTGAQGLPLMGTGDWNDGMNRVGREGRGESVWLGFFLFEILRHFIQLAKSRGDDERAARWQVYRERLHAALNDAGWDGEWYRRAYYDDGTPLGTKSAAECRIDGLAQSWAVLSNAASPERAAQAMREAEKQLIDEEAGIIRLLTPPFVDAPEDPGYIKGYVSGVRENGGQYTHAACWMIRAMAKLGRRDRAARLLEMISPLSHTRTPERLDRYKAEPYVIAADVYGAAPHVGRGGWTWYTGSAGWAWRVAVESVLGLRIEGGDTLVLEPCVPDEWKEWRIDYLYPPTGTRFHIQFNRTSHQMDGSWHAKLDGREVAVRNGKVSVPLLSDGGSHVVEVVLDTPTTE